MAVAFLLFVRPHPVAAATTFSIGGQVTNSGQAQPVGKTGFLITLSGPTSRSALTGGSGGSYFFSGLPKGQYILHLVLPSGYTSCGPTTVMTSLGPSKVINFCVSYIKPPSPPPPPPSPSTATCGGFTSSVAHPNPNQPFDLTVAVKFNPATAAGTDFGPDTLTAKLTGPAPFVGAATSTTSPSISGSKVSTVLSVPATHIGGTYSLTWAIIGSQAPTISCSDTILVAYTPYFTVAGGDASAGQGFGGGCTGNVTADIEGVNLDSGTAPANYFGAGAQQAAIATGGIKHFATDTIDDESADVGGSTSGLAALQPNALALANASPVSGTYGGGILKGLSGTGWCVPDYATGVGAATSTTMPTSVELNNLAVSSQNYVYRVSGDQQLNGDIKLQPGIHVTIVVTDGDFYLDGNVRYANYSSLQNIPQFTLILSGASSGNLYVDKSVRELHGFYDSQPSSGGSTNGNIFTCASAMSTKATSYAACNTPLTFYGAVAAKEIIPGRTYGNLVKSAGIPNEPAERFVYTPELWLGIRAGCTRNLTAGGCNYQAYTSLPPVL